jgi:hypothetical protein
LSDTNDQIFDQTGLGPDEPNVLIRESSDYRHTMSSIAWMEVLNCGRVLIDYASGVNDPFFVDVTCVEDPGPAPSFDPVIRAVKRLVIKYRRLAQRVHSSTNFVQHYYAPLRAREIEVFHVPVANKIS